MATIKQLEKLGFEGIDASLEISLFEYRLAFRPTKENEEYQFLYLVDGEDFFETGFYSKGSFETLLGESWFNVPGFWSFADTDKADMLARFPHSMADAISYYGTENIFGSSYGGFILRDFKPTKY